MFTLSMMVETAVFFLLVYFSLPLVEVSTNKGEILYITPTRTETDTTHIMYHPFDPVAQSRLFSNPRTAFHPRGDYTIFPEI